MLVCVRWYAAYPLSLRQIEEMMVERGVFVDHATAYRWAIKILPASAVVFGRPKRIVDTSWRMDETYIKATQRSLAAIGCRPSDRRIGALPLTEGRGTKSLA